MYRIFLANKQYFINGVVPKQNNTFRVKYTLLARLLKSVFITFIISFRTIHSVTLRACLI